MSISNSAMLVELNIGVWTGQKVDRAATTKVTDDANAAADAGQFKKNLTAGTSLRKDIADYAALCRTWHNGRTMPWSDRGPRLLPTSMFLEYKKEVNARRDYFMAKVDKFCETYPQLLADAPQHLGDLFNPTDYPSIEEVRNKFGFHLVFSPVPESGDFRLSAGEADMAELKAQYDVAYDARVKDAMQSAWDKVHALLTKMSEKLTEPEGESAKPKMYHSTLITNVHDMCALLTHFNVTKDPQLEQTRRALEKLVSNVDIDDIRKDVGARIDLKAQVDAALSKFDW
jgi:hypothetical protein